METSDVQMDSKVTEIKVEAKKRGRKPKTKTVIETVDIEPEPAPVVNEVEVPAAQETPEIVQADATVVSDDQPPELKVEKTKTKQTVRKSKPRQTKVTEANMETEEEHVQAQVHTFKEVTPEERRMLVHEFVKNQNNNKRAAKQERYKRLLSSAFKFLSCFIYICQQECH